MLPRLNTPGSITNNGLIEGTSGVNLHLDGNLANTQAVITTDNGPLSIAGFNNAIAGNIVNTSGEISANGPNGDLQINAASLTNNVLGGVKEVAVHYQKDYTEGLANPLPLDQSKYPDGTYGDYYYGQKVIQLDTPPDLGTGHVLAALFDGDASSHVLVTGEGATVTAANTPALIGASRNLTLNINGAVSNDASHITAGNDINIVGGSLNNVGYTSSVTYMFQCFNGSSCRFFDPPTDIASPDINLPKQDIGSPPAGNAWPAHIWATSGSGTGFSGTLVAGGTITGNLTGAINNKTVVVGALPGEIPNYTGNTPSGITAPGQSGAIAPGASLGTVNTGNLNAAEGGNGSSANQVTGNGPGFGNTADLSSRTANADTGNSATNPDLSGLKPGEGGSASTGQSSVGSSSLALPDAGTGSNAVGQNGNGQQVGTPGAVAGAGAQSLPGSGGILPPQVTVSHQNGQAVALPGFQGTYQVFVGSGLTVGNGGNTAGGSSSGTGTTSPPTATLVDIVASIPGGRALFVPNPSPDISVLIETNPSYATAAGFYGSQYLLNKVGDAPSNYKFLGDAGFDTRYVQQQIVSATGQIFMDSTINNASDQMRILLDNAASQATASGLNVGIPLTAAQQQALTSDIVWYVPVTVNGQQVLAPQLYLAPGHSTLASGAAIAGKNVNLTGSSITNSGSISAQNDLVLTSRNGDILNEGGTLLAGGNFTATAHNGSFVNTDTLNHYLTQTGTQEGLANKATVTAGKSATVVADRDITFTGGTLSSGGDLNMVAGQNITLNTRTAQAQTDFAQDRFTFSNSQTRNEATTISSGGNALLAALGGNLTAQGAQLSSSGDMTLYAGQNIDLGSYTNSEATQDAGSERGFLTSSAFSDQHSWTHEQGSAVTSENGSLTAVAGDNLTLKGVLGALGNVDLSAGKAITIDATKDTTADATMHKTSKFGFFTDGLSASVGSKFSKDTASSATTIYTSSVVASTGGSVDINAGKQVTLNGSGVSAAHDVTIAGSDVTFNAVTNHEEGSESHVRKTAGFGLGLSGNSIAGQVGNSIQSATHTHGAGSGVLGTLYGLQGAYSSAIGADALNGLELDQLGALNDNPVFGGVQAIGVQAGFNFGSSKWSSSYSKDTVQGSSAQAGDALTIIARGDPTTTTPSKGTITATASTLAGKDVTLAAPGDITLQAGTNTTTTHSDNHSTGISVGVAASIGSEGAGLSATATGSHGQGHANGTETTAVDTTVTGTNSVTIANAGGITTLNGAEVKGGHIAVQTGSLSITSSQNTAQYSSKQDQGGGTVSASFLGAGTTGASGSVAHSTITNNYSSTSDVLSGLYAGQEGLSVDVSGKTSLVAGVIASEADKALNHFSTGSLEAKGLENHSDYSGTPMGFLPMG
ncbi:hemagglutinin repeat-containing protein [Entomobacter blattae]|uniref:Hemagglutinin repeat protein n=1 Tax=Entomobacter blattae TaxID=2762277 RepID=A0A7H1NNN7_9PROT|nr:hemagglutinin repeat-containing protein [Entomobacter blattae]QNT77397.1 Hemagglutinin repeat protein [Entomobacter blattae]